MNDYDRIQEALGHIPASCERQDWVKVAMALHDALGDAGEDLWHDWSSSAPDQYDRRAAVAVWRSVHTGSHTGRRVTAGTLYHMAQQYGWTPPRKPGRSRRPHVPRQVLLHAAYVLLVAQADVQAGRHVSWTTEDRATVRESLELLIANPPRLVPMPAQITHHKPPDPLLRLRSHIADAIEGVRRVFE